MKIISKHNNKHEKEKRGRIALGSGSRTQSQAGKKACSSILKVSVGCTAKSCEFPVRLYRQKGFPQPVKNPLKGNDSDEKKVEPPIDSPSRR